MAIFNCLLCVLRVSERLVGKILYRNKNQITGLTQTNSLLPFSKLITGQNININNENVNKVLGTMMLQIF